MKTLQFLRNIALLLTLFFSDVIFAQGNEYFNVNPYWQVNKMCAVPYPCIQNETYNYFIGGDSSVNTLTYKKVMKQGSGYYSWMGNPPAGCSGTYMYIDTIPWCLVRSAGKQMYVWMPSDTAEQLLFDFNLQVGDTLPISYTTWNNDVFVTAIDSFNTGVGYKKRFALGGNTWATYLLEGVGSDKGLLEPVSVALECGYNLICYGTNDTAWYPVQGPTCNLHVAVSPTLTQSKLSVYPNPANTHVQITAPEFVNEMTITIIDVYGRILESYQSTNGNSAFSCEHLAIGAYWIFVQSASDTFQAPLIITR